jgi:hypothetical protein
MDANLSRRALLAGGLAFAAGCRVRTGGNAEPTTTVRPTPGPRQVIPPPAQGQWYDIAIGDTFHSISRRSGIRLEDLIAGNRGIDIRDLRIGQRVWLPTATPLIVRQLVATRAKPGDVIESQDALPGVAGTGYVLVPRSAWTSEAVGKNHNLMNGVSRITVHHTGEHAGLADLPELEVLRRIERYHRRERGWCAIGYHYIVGKDGRVYEGRPTKYQGAHVLSNNEHNIGISVSGDFMKKLPSPAQLHALTAFLDEGRTKYSVSRAKIYGHRDLNSSLCPGDALYRWLKTYKNS